MRTVLEEHVSIGVPRQGSFDDLVMDACLGAAGESGQGGKPGPQLRIDRPVSAACERCGERQTARRRRGLCESCCKLIKTDPVLQLEYPARERSRRLHSAWRLVMEGQRDCVQIARLMGISPRSLQRTVLSAAGVDDPRALAIMERASGFTTALSLTGREQSADIEDLEAEALSPHAGLSSHDRRAAERLEDCLDLISWDEKDLGNIAQRLGLTLNALERFLYRWRAAGDERARRVLEATHRPTSLHVRKSVA